MNHCVYVVSTHTLTRRATAGQNKQCCNLCVSTHVPIMGAIGLPSPSFPPVMFQSTLPRGERFDILKREVSVVDVSIHALMWRATSQEYPPLVSQVRFNSRSHTGNDSQHISMRRRISWFQFTSSQGRRRLCFQTQKWLERFQLTPYRGERPLPKRLASVHSWFQSTLPHRERRA